MTQGSSEKLQLSNQGRVIGWLVVDLLDLIRGICFVWGPLNP